MLEKEPVGLGSSHHMLRVTVPAEAGTDSRGWHRDQQKGSVLSLWDRDLLVIHTSVFHILDAS